MEAEAFAGAVHGGFADTEPSGDLGLGEALPKPAADKLFLGPVQLAAAARGGSVLQAVEAILLVASFPACWAATECPKA